MNVTSAGGVGSPFEDRGMWLVVAALVLLALVTTLGLALVYYGDAVVQPSWNEHSVPAPEP